MPTKPLRLISAARQWTDDRFRQHPYGWGWLFALSSGLGLGLYDILTQGPAQHLRELLQPEQLVYHFGLPFILGASAARRGKQLRETSARARAESEQALSEQKHRTLVGNIPGLVYRVHLRENSRMEFFNAPLADHFTGYLPEELPVTTSRALNSIVVEGDRTRVEDALRAAIDKRGQYEISFGIRHRDGTQRHMLDRGSVVSDAAGPAFIDGVILDITDSRRMQDELLAERDFAEGLIDTAPVIVMVLDKTGAIVRFNKFTEETTGYQLAEVRGRDVGDFLAEADRPLATERFSTALASGIAPAATTFLATRSGGRREIMWHLRRLGAAADSDIRVLAIGQDLTEQRDMEEKLRQSEKLQALGQLAGGIAHDFNNQLSGILGYAELLRERITESEKLRGYAQSISVAARRAADLTSKLLAFARKGKSRTVPVDIHTLVSEVAAIFERSTDRLVSIVLLLRADPPLTSGDPTQLQSSLLNLALNARDAMPQGGTLTIETDVCILDEEFCQSSTFAVTPGAYVQVSFTDTGIGMDDDVQRRIFEPFFTTKPTGQGIGMGLPAVYGTVRAHHGALAVRSAPGKGSTFTLYFPLGNVRDSPTISEPETSVGGSGRIMLVDDEDVAREMIAEMLTSVGYTILQCRDGLEAVRQYGECWQQIDLVILDLVMPKMSGRETFLGMHAVNPNVHVLIASGYSIDGEAERLIALGARGFIQKPFRKSELTHQVAQTLGKAPTVQD